jgi:hypothetical protein
MTARDGNATTAGSEETSYDDLLTPEETYEGSRHFSFTIDLDHLDLELDDETEPSSSTRTVIMSPALLAELRTEVCAQTADDSLHTRPTERSMTAVRPEHDEWGPPAKRCARG